jgi:hypothetical protein
MNIRHLKNHLNKLESKVRDYAAFIQQRDKRYMHVFAYHEGTKWMVEEQRFENETLVNSIEAWLLDEKDKPLFEQAKNLSELRALCDENNIKLHVYAVSDNRRMEDLWTDVETE